MEISNHKSQDRNEGEREGGGGSIRFVSAKRRTRTRKNQVRGVDEADPSEVVQSLSTVSFPLLALPSWIDDSSRKPRLLDLAERAMICSPGVLHARPSNSTSRLESLPLSLYLCPLLDLLAPTHQIIPTDSSGSTRAVLSAFSRRDVPSLLSVFSRRL